MSGIMKLFYVFAKPLAIFLFWLYGLVGNYGIAIIIFTIVVRTILFPLYNSQMKQSAMMSELQPELNKLQKQYGADKEKYNQKVMEFYQETGMNPAKGCLPLIIQMPILFGLFAALRSPLDYYTSNTEAILAIHQSFLWIQDLSQPDKWILPILAGITTYFSYKITASANPQTQNSMKAMQYVFPIMIVWWGRSFPAGLTMYWFIGTLYMCIQQKIVFAKIKKDRAKREAEREAQRQYEKEHPELFKKEEPVKKTTIVEEEDIDAYDDEIESMDDYSDFYTEEELEEMRKEQAKEKAKAKYKKKK